VLSHDASCYIDWLPHEAFDLMPRWHYLHITKDVIPALKDRGVTDEQIDQMLIHNPKKVFDQKRGAY
jgi:phosphotriesterase-related protein